MENDMKLETMKTVAQNHIQYLMNEVVAQELKNRTKTGKAIQKAAHSVKTDLGTPAKIYEWYNVSVDFATKAQPEEELIIATEYGMLWGRTSDAQPIHQDQKVQTILAAIN